MIDPLKWVLTCCCIALFSGCGRTIPTPAERFQLARQLAAADATLQPQIYQAAGFQLFAYQSSLQDCRGKTVHLYLEGDGLAWITPSTISTNPTPLNPIGLKLAIQDADTCRIYLARPCQYLTDFACTEKYWTSHRFSQQIIDSYQDVCNTIKKRYAVSSFALFGFSGGGAIAALLAAQRNDVASLVTIAGNLDTAFWVKEHFLTPLSASLNPADFARELANVEQTHLIGTEDKVVGSSIYASYQSRFRDTSRLHVKYYQQFDHACCWDRAWPTILEDLEQ